MSTTMKVHIVPVLIVIAATQHLWCHSKFLKHLEKDWINVPVSSLNLAVIASAGVFCAQTIITARQTAWQNDDMLTVMSILTGIFVGFTANLK